MTDELSPPVGDPAEIARLRAQINESEKWRLAVQATCDTFQQQIRRLQGEAVQAEAQIAAQDKAIAFVMRDIGNVITVADRRIYLDADHRAMLVRLRQWYSALASLPAAPVSTPDDDAVTRGDGVPGVGHGDLPRRNDGDK